MNKILKSDKNLVFIGNNATEKNFKKLKNLSSEIITFATHGLTSGSVNDLNQSALLMTPPKEIIEEDDGLLKADEIIKIKIPKLIKG